MPFPDDDATFENVTVLGSLIAGDPGGQRIEVVPDYNGLGDPGIVFYDPGGNVAAVLALVASTLFGLISADGDTSVIVQDDQIDISAGVSPNGVINVNAGDSIHFGQLPDFEGAPFSLAHSQAVGAVGAGGTSTSATFVNLPVRLRIASFTKHHDDTALVVAYGGSLINNNALGPIEVAADINGANHLLCGYFASSMDSGFVQVDGLAAGSYAIEIQWRRPTATGTLVQVAARSSMMVTETMT